jgi:hypothetical protein
MKLKLNLLFILLLFSFLWANAQELDNVTTTLENGIMVVRFDFLQGDPDTEYELYLFSSHDNFQKPLQETTGDVGKGVKIGAGKVIYWNAEKELGVFEGYLSLKIKGSKYVPFVQYSNINDQLKLKRGEQFNIQWKPGDKSRQVLMEIKKNGIPVEDPMIIDNSGSYAWKIPEKAKPGKGYTIQIKDIENNLRAETSHSFSVKRKVPLGYIIVPAAVVTGGVLYFLLNQPEPGGIPEPPSIPSAN